MTRDAFENAIVVASAIAGSTNCPIHVNAIARHVGVDLTNDDWESVGGSVPRPSSPTASSSSVNSGLPSLRE